RFGNLTNRCSCPPGLSFRKRLYRRRKSRCFGSHAGRQLNSMLDSTVFQDGLCVGESERQQCAHETASSSSTARPGLKRINSERRVGTVTKASTHSDFPWRGVRLASWV